MFSKKITSPIAPLTRTYFNNISRPENEPDWTLSSLGVALLRTRIEDYNGLRGGYYFVQNAVSAAKVAHETIEFRKKITDVTAHPSIYYYIAPVDTTELDCFKKAMEKEGLEELKPVEQFVFQQLEINIAVHIYKENNSAFIFSGTGDMSVYHLCAAFICNLLPMAFENKKLTPDEIQILRALNHKTPDAFIELTSKALQPLKAELMRAELLLCLQGFKEAKIRSAEATVQSKRDRAEQCLSQYKQMIEQLEEAIIAYEGLKVVNGADDVEQELVDYLVDNPCLHNISYDSGILIFDVTTLLVNFDSMKWRNAVKMYDIYNNYRMNETNVFNNRENRKLLLNALFDTPNPELNVKVRGRIALHINRNYMDVERGDRFDETNSAIKNCLTNPHFKIHGCPGQNRAQIIECLSHGDIMSAIEASIAATGSVNIAETDITFRPFVCEILNSSKRIIHRNDGVDMTPAEALLWLKTKENVA